MVVDALAQKYQATFKKSAFEAEVAEFFLKGEKILLVKPQTFMNESGRAVGPLMTYFGIYQEELVVVYDGALRRATSFLKQQLQCWHKQTQCLTAY